MNKYIVCFVIASLFSLSAMADEICLHHECQASFYIDPSSGAIRGNVCQVYTGDGEFEVNDIWNVNIAWTNVAYPNGHILEPIDPDLPFYLEDWRIQGSRGPNNDSDRYRNYFYNEYCTDTSEILIDGFNDFSHIFNGANVLKPYRQGVSVDQAWHRYESWVSLDGEWIMGLCSLRTREEGYGDGPIVCSDSRSFSIDELDNEQDEALKLVERLLNDVIESYDEFEQSVQRTITELDGAVDQLRGRAPGEIAESDIDGFDFALTLFRDLQMSLDELKEESEILRDQFDRTVNDVNTVIQEQLARNNISPTDYDTRHPLVLDDIDIPLLVDVDHFSPENDFYSDYADHVIANLTTLYLAGDNAAFITSVNAWVISSQRLRDNLVHETYQSPAEWEALTLSFERVEHFIFGSDTQPPKLDRDFWFSDSPVTMDQREAIGVIADNYARQGGIIEAEVRTWRGRDLTEEQFRLLQSFQALGSGITELLNSSLALSAEIDNLVSGAAVAAKDGVQCVATVAIAGDFGDFYELISGKSICSGVALSGSERMLSGLGLVIGNGTFWRGVARATGLLPGAKTAANIVASVVEKAGKVGAKSREQVDEIASLVNGTLPCTRAATSRVMGPSASRLQSSTQSAPTCISPDLAKVLDDALDGADDLEIDNFVDLQDLIQFSSTPLLPSPSSNIANKIERMNEVKNIVGLSAKEIRNLPGTSTASRNLVNSGKLLRGTHGNAGLIPKEVGDALVGRNFNDFGDFREAFWLAVSNSRYADEFDDANKALISLGKSPNAVKTQQTSGRRVYELHHIEPINRGGSVYDMSNLMIVTPRFHQEVLDRSYHYGN